MKLLALACGIALILPLTKASDAKLAATSTFQLSATTYRVRETAGAATIAVNRTGTVTAQGRVDFATGPNGADPGEDYEAVTGTLTWAAGESGTKTFQIPIIRDTFEEEPQEFIVGILNAVGGGILSTRREASVIIDDPAVAFEELWGSVFPASVSLPLLVSVSTITAQRVEFLSGTNILGTDTTPRAGDGYYEFTWADIPRGAYTIRARAVQADGTSFTSPARNILIAGPGQTVGLPTVHVAEINNTGLENGSAQNPFTTIQKGIDSAAPNATIKIAAGTYQESLLIDYGPIQLLGGYSSDFTTRDIKDNQVKIIPPARGLGIGLFNALATKIDGVTISNASRGIHIFAETVPQSSVTLSHNTISKNGDAFRAAGGGGIHAENSSLELTDSEISFNVGGRGAGLSVVGLGASVAIRNNSIRSNVAYDDHGGGLYLAINGVIANNLVISNKVGQAVDYGGWGGGILVFGEFAQVVLSNNIVAGNIGGTGTAEFFDEGAKATISNELIYGNIGSGHAIYVDGCCSSSVQLSQSTVVNNIGGGIVTDIPGTSAVISNSIFWNPGYDEFSAVNGSTIQISYTLSEQPIVTGSGITAGAGNLQADPLFADALNNDYRLKTTRGRWSPVQQSWIIDAVNSPAIDAGNPTSDFSWEAIPNGNRVDLGAFGNRSESHLTAAIVSQQLRITARGVNGRAYFIESSADLQNWSELTSITSATGQIEYNTALPSTPRFFRFRQ